MAKLEDQIKTLLMLDSTVYEQYQEFLQETIEDTKSELAILLKEEVVPDHFFFIIKKVVTKRFNRRKHEGVKAASIAESRTEYQTDDFEEFRGIIQDYLDDKEDTGRPQRGKMRFI